MCVIMNRKINLLFLVALLCLGTVPGFSQNSDTKRADALYNALQYVNAIDAYQKLLKEGKGNRYVYEKLANSYYAINDTKKSETFYRRVVKGRNPKSELVYNYAQSLKANEKYKEYSIWMKKFVAMEPRDSRAILFMEDPDYLPTLLKSAPTFSVVPIDGINTAFSEFGGTTFGNDFYFSSARNLKRRESGVDGQAYLDIYKANLWEGSPKNAQLLNSKEVNTKYHEANVAITPDGQRMYFDRNDYEKGDYGKSDSGVSQVHLYYASWVDGMWQDVQSVPFNDKNYSTGHPALSSNGNTLYFVSDMPGSLGMSDIYKVSIDKNGGFGVPQRLEGTINTEGKEVFPFVDDQGNLYFSSDGHLGLGGLDIFYAEPSATGFDTVQNLGPIVNTPKDDFAFTYDATTETGFLSSNRSGGKGSDDIYRTLKIATPCEANLLLTIVNEYTKEPIVLAEITIHDSQGNKLSAKTSDASGEAEFVATCDENYEVRVVANDFESATLNVEDVLEGYTQRTILLRPIDELIVANKVVLNPIYFDLDKSNITSKAAFELDKLVNLMKKYPSMIIRAESHTDSRGDEKYNLDLSERRAQSTVQYIISQGIDAERISGQGFGEGRLLIDCGTDCTSVQHQQNRRSEFIIMER